MTGEIPPGRDHPRPAPPAPWERRTSGKDFDATPPTRAQPVRIPPRTVPPQGRPLPPRDPYGRAAPTRIPPGPPRPRVPPAPRPVASRPPAPRRESSQPQRSAPTATALLDEPASDRQSTSRLLAASGSIAIATLISRITGFVKQVLLLTVLGPLVASAYTVASVIPNMIAEFVLGAVLTAIVVPVLVRAEREDPDRGQAFVRRLFTAALTTLAVAAVLATAAAPLLTQRVFLSADGKVDTGLTTALLFLLLPAILFYGLSALFTAILNTRQNFKPGAWAPVLNNLVVLTVLAIYVIMPGEISIDPTRMSDPKLLVLGLGVTLGVVTQVVSLIPALRRNHIDLRPLWGLDDRLRQFGGMAVAIVLYVLISQMGMIFATRISSHADAAGPAIYNNAWLLLQLPYGVLGVTLLTAIMPRLSRNAAAQDTPAVVDDLSVATRMTMLALIPVIGFLTVAGPQVGQALYGYGNFGSDAGRLGEAVSWSAFTLIPYSLVLIHLRVFYAREQAWTPTWIVLGITTVKIGLSALAPVLASSDRQVVLMLGVANGLGYTMGAIIGWTLLRRSLGNLKLAGVQRTVTVVVAATAFGGTVMWILDRVLRLANLTDSFGGIGSLLRIAFDGALMLLIVLAILYRARIPEVVAVFVAINRKLGRGTPLEDDGSVRSPAEPDSMFAQTELIPVIRVGSSHVTSDDVLPYPGDRRAGSYGRERGDANRFVPADETETTVFPAYTGRYATSTGEGVALTDDEVAGGRVPSADRDDNGSGGVSTDARRLDTDAAGTPVSHADESASDDSPAADITADDADADTSPVPERVDQAADPAETVSGPDETVAEHELPVQAAPASTGSDTGAIPVGSPVLPPMGSAEPPRAALRGPKLIPGASVAGGRYRLLAPHGGARGLKFWQAHDVKLDREVALTFVDADQRAAGDGAGSVDGPQAVLSRTLRLGRINSPGLARVLDVVRGSSGGIVVAEWTRGRSLREMAETAPSPIGAANAIKSLAAAAEAAHRGGGALSIDHPDRVRISTKGDAVLAFPATLGDADPGSDVRGLGAMLYALITARWPLNEPVDPRSSAPASRTSNVGGMRPADRTSIGAPVEPRAIRPDVPFEISAVAVRALEQNSGIRTAATVQHILDQAAVINEKTEMLPALRLGQRAPGASGHALADPDDQEAQKKKSNLMIVALVALGVFTVAILGLVGWWLANFLAGGGSDTPLNEQPLGLTTSAQAPAAPGAPAPAASTTAVPISKVEVFSPQGSADNPGTVDRVTDNNPATVWETDSYFQPFPSLKNGVGVLATLDSPTTLTSVWINSPSPGTVVEIRSASSSSPTLDQTQVIGSATLGQGVTTIAVNPDGQVDHILYWITDLATSGGGNKSTIADLGATTSN